MRRLTPRSTLLLTLLIVAAAAFLRIDQYFAGRSLWLDESLLALNVIDRPFSRLSDPLSLSQGSPLGFLVAAKLSVLSLGKSELALRFVPLLCGLASIGLFAVLARRVSNGLAALLGLALYACSHSLIYYSVEFKQYATEVAAVLALSLVAIPDGHLRARRYLAVSLLGAALLWVAYTTVFFLAAFASAYGLAFLVGRRWRDLATFAGGSLIWLASGFAVYKISYDDLDSVRGSVQAVSGDSTSAILQQLIDAATLIASGAGFFRDTRPHTLVTIGALTLCLTGAIVLLRARPYVFLMLALPIAFMFAAVLIERYPVFERTILIGIPAVILFIAHGTGFVVRRLRAPLAAPVGAVIAILLLFYPVRIAVEDIGTPIGNNQGGRLLLRELAERWQPGDTLYVHYAAQYVFRYYAECACIDVDGESLRPPLTLADRRTIGPNLWHPALLSRPPNLVIGARHEPGDWAAYLREIDPLQGRRRVWILSSHWESSEEKEYLVSLLPERLDRLGTRKEFFNEGAGQLMLYDLSEPG